eukprot:scaffold172149_cov36-Prasinocladus_malaysianus.AAC.1
MANHHTLIRPSRADLTAVVIINGTSRLAKRIGVRCKHQTTTILGSTTRYTYCMPVPAAQLARSVSTIREVGGLKPGRSKEYNKRSYKQDPWPELCR